MLAVDSVVGAPEALPSGREAGPMCQERACLGSSLGSLGAMGMEKLWSSRAWPGAQESECKPGPGHRVQESVGPASS